MSQAAATNLSCEWLTHKETHTGKLKSSEHLLLYNEIELAIKESKKEEKKHLEL